MRSPDWDFWLKMSRIELWKACALSVDIDPDHLAQWDTFTTGQPPDSPVFHSEAFRDVRRERTFYKRVRLTMASYADSQNFRRDPFIRSLGWKRIYLTDFVNWAVKIMRWEDLPPELASIAKATAPSDTKPEAKPEPPHAAGWQSNARAIGERLRKEYRRLSVGQIAEKVYSEMKAQSAAGTPGMTGRGGRVPSAGTIKRHALAGLSR